MASVLEELEGLFPAAAAETVYEVRLDLISPDPHQPRKDFDSAELDDLALSIEANGVLTPILLRPDTDHPGRYLLVAGERRFRASERARRTSIPAVIREVEPSTLLVLQLIENVQRSDLRPLETAQALSDLLASSPGLTQTRAAALLGKSPAWLSQHLALLAYQGSTQEALAAHLLQSPETARRFDQLPPEVQRELLEKARAAGAPITRPAVEAARTVASPPSAPSSGSPGSPAPKRAGRPPKEKNIPLPALTRAELASLFARLDLGPVPPRQAEIWEAFLSRLRS
jgi:ParB family chromosome partitioning protein